MDTSNSDFLPLLSISREKAERNLEDARNYISIDLANIRSVIMLYHPLELAKMSVWEERRVSRLGKTDMNTAAARLLPILIQSILMSRDYPGRGMNRDVKKKDWQRLISLSQDLTRKLVRYVDNLAAWHYISGTVSREDVMDYRTSLFVQYFPSEKTPERLQTEKLFAEMSLAGEKDRVAEVFGIEPSKLIAEMGRLAENGLTMIDDLVAESTEFRNTVELRTAQMMSENPGMEEAEARNRVFMDASIMTEKISLEGRRDDFDLFRPEFTADLPRTVYERMSAGPGSFDLSEWLFEKGMWPATVYPFYKIQDMYFSFVAKYIFAVSSRLSENFLALRGRVEAASTAALEALFTPTDFDWIYEFDGHRVDVEILSVLSDVNPVTQPEYWQTQQKRKSEEYLAKPEYGHKMIIVDADDEADEVEDIGGGRFWTTAYHLMRVYAHKEMRFDFYTSLFGEFNLGESDPLLEEIDDEDVLVPGNVAGPIAPEVFTEEGEEAEIEEEKSDELVFDALDDDLYEDEKPASSDEDEGDDDFDPMSVSMKKPDALERMEYSRIYEDNMNIIEKNEGKPVPVSEYTGVLDEDMYSQDDDDDFTDDDEDEAEAPYIEVVDEDDLAKDPTDTDDEEDEVDSDQLDFMDLLDDFDNRDEDSEDTLEMDPEENVEVPGWTGDDEKASFPADETEEEELSDVDELTEEEDNDALTTTPFPEDETEEEGLSDLNELTEDEDNDAVTTTPFPADEAEEEGLSDFNELTEEDDTDLPEEKDIYDEEVVELLSEKLGRPATIEDQKDLEELLDDAAKTLAEGLSEDDVKDTLALIESEALESEREEKAEIAEAWQSEAEHSDDEGTSDDEEIPEDLYDGEEEEDDEDEDGDDEEVFELTDEAIDVLYSDEVLEKLADYIGHEPELEDKKWLYDLMDDELKKEDLTEEDYNSIATAVLDILSDPDYECGCGDPECHCHDHEDGEEHECCHCHDDEEDDEDEEDEEEEDHFELTDEALDEIYSDEVLGMLEDYIGREPRIEDKRWLYDLIDDDLKQEDLTEEDYNSIASAVLTILADRENEEIGEDEDYNSDREEDEVTGEEDSEEEEDGDESEVCEMTDEAIDALYSDEVIGKLAEFLGHEPELNDKKWLYNLMDDELKAEDLTEDDYNDIASQTLDILSSPDCECGCDDPECHCHDHEEGEEHECCHCHDAEDDDDEDEEDEDEWEEDEDDVTFEMTDEAIECLYSDEVLEMLAAHVGHEPTLDDKRWLYDQMDESLRNEDLTEDDYNAIAAAVLTIMDDLEDDESEHMTDEITGYEEEEGFGDEDSVLEMTDEALECLWNGEVTDRLALHVGHTPTAEDRRWLYDEIDESLRNEDLSGEDWNDMALAALNILEDRDEEPADDITDEELDALYDDEVLALLEERLGRKPTVDDKRDLYNTLDRSAHEIAKSVTEQDLLEAIALIENFDDEYPAEEKGEGVVSDRREDYHPFEMDDDHTAVTDELPPVDEAERENPMYFFVDDDTLDEDEPASEEETEEESGEELQEPVVSNGTSFAFIDEEEDEVPETAEESVAEEDADAPAFFLSGDAAEEETETEEASEEVPSVEEPADELTPELDFTEEETEEEAEEAPSEEEEVPEEAAEEETAAEEGSGEEETPAEDDVLTTDEKVIPAENVHDELPTETAPKKENDEIVLEYADDDETEAGLTPEEELEEVKKEVILESELMAEAEKAEEEAEEPAPAVEEPVEEEVPAEEEKPVVKEAPKSASDGKLTSDLAKSLFFDIPGISPEMTPAKKSETIVLEYEDEEEPGAEDGYEEDGEEVPVRPAGAEDGTESVPAEEEENEKVFVVAPNAAELVKAPAPEVKTESEPIMSTEDQDDEIAELEDEKSITLDLENPKFSIIIREIAQALGRNAGAFAEFLENEERAVLDHFNQVIKQSWERQLSDGKDKMFSIFDYDLSVLLSKSKVYDELRLEELLNNAGAVMYSKGRESWNALMVYINKDYNVESAELRVITKDDFSAANWKIVSNIGEELIHRRMK